MFICVYIWLCSLESGLISLLLSTFAHGNISLNNYSLLAVKLWDWGGLVVEGYRRLSCKLDVALPENYFPLLRTARDVTWNLEPTSLHPRGFDADVVRVIPRNELVSKHDLAGSRRLDRAFYQGLSIYLVTLLHLEYVGLWEDRRLLVDARSLCGQFKWDMRLVHLWQDDVSERDLLDAEIIEQLAEVLENELVSELALGHHALHSLDVAQSGCLGATADTPTSLRSAWAKWAGAPPKKAREPLSWFFRRRFRLLRRKFRGWVHIVLWSGVCRLIAWRLPRHARGPLRIFGGVGRPVVRRSYGVGPRGSIEDVHWWGFCEFLQLAAVEPCSLFLRFLQGQIFVYPRHLNLDVLFCEVLVQHPEGQAHHLEI